MALIITILALVAFLCVVAFVLVAVLSVLFCFLNVASFSVGRLAVRFASALLLRCCLRVVGICSSGYVLLSVISLLSFCSRFFAVVLIVGAVLLSVVVAALVVAL